MAVAVLAVGRAVGAVAARSSPVRCAVAAVSVPVVRMRPTDVLVTTTLAVWTFLAPVRPTTATSSTWAAPRMISATWPTTTLLRHPRGAVRLVPLVPRSLVVGVDVAAVAACRSSSRAWCRGSCCRGCCCRALGQRSAGAVGRWAAALTFAAFWLPFASGLRSETVIVLGSAAHLVAPNRQSRRGGCCLRPWPR